MKEVGNNCLFFITDFHFFLFRIDTIVGHTCEAVVESQSCPPFAFHSSEGFQVESKFD